MPTRDWITKDFGWKLFSLILAVASWIAIHRNIAETPTTLISFGSVQTASFTNVTVTAVSTSADVHNAQVVPNTVTVKLSGPPGIVAVLEENKVHAMVNLTGINAANELRLPVDVSAPPGVAIDNIDPPKVSVTFSPATE